MPFFTAFGSSPLTRGKLKLRISNDGGSGLIPAHAGKTLFVVRGGEGVEAHPRSRGENQAGLDASLRAGGSSPLTRGKHDTQQGERRTVGLIPAHAGKTRTARRPTTCGAAHPRSRGENKRAEIFDEAFHGSSPLTRGKH